MKTFTEYEDSQYLFSGNYDEKRFITNSEFYAILAMLDDLANEIDKINSKIENL